MGADLYIPSVYERTRQRYEPSFRHWVERRDAASTTAEREAAQRRVSKYFEKLYGAGYFRDSYNRTDLLWLFGLSWWGDVLTRLDEEGRLSTWEAAWLVAELAHREDIFEDNLAKQELEPGDTREDVERNFREKYASLKAFLAEATRRHEAIECSL